MLQTIIIVIILGLNSASFASSIVREVFPGPDYNRINEQFNSWESTLDPVLLGEWKFILYSIDPKAKLDLWWVTSVEEKVVENGFRNNFDGSEYNLLSITPKLNNSCDSPYLIEVRNILYAGLNQVPSCLHAEVQPMAYSFQQSGMTPSLDWKTDSWYQYQCRKKQFGKDVFLLCRISLGGDWMTGNQNWNEPVQKWLGRNFGYFGFWKKKNQ
ncbi:MAG: hypothetical protein AABY64_04790 [Bdellovibrionota bacterium]